MKTKLRIAFWEFSQIEISPIRNGSLETREDLIEFKIVCLLKLSFYFSAEIFALEWHSGAKNLNSALIVN